MSSTVSVTLLRVAFKERLTADGLIDLLSQNEYDEVKGIGFKDAAPESNSYVVATGVKRTPIFVNIFDDATQGIVEREAYILTEIEFAIDLKLKFIEVYGSQQDLKKLLGLFRQLVTSTIGFQQIETSPAEAVTILRSPLDTIELQSMLIKEFRYSEGIVGTYDAQISRDALGWDLVKEYKNQISKVAFAFSYGSASGFVNWAHGCKLRVRTNSEEDFHKFLRLTKTRLNRP